MIKTVKEFFSKDIVRILTLIITSRVALAIIGMCARMVFSGNKPWNYVSTLWLDIWGVWDTGWYMNIAENGYSALPQNPEGQYSYAFFPLYPYLIRAVGALIQNNFIAGIIVSNLCFAIACIFFYKLMRLDHDNETAHRAVKYMVLFPLAFVFSGIFTESLFIMLLILSFYFAKKEQWMWVGLAGVFLALTRSIGVFTVLPIFFLYLSQKNFSWKKIRPDILWLLGFPIGLGLFMLLNYAITGDFLAFVHAQSGWGRHFLGPWTAFWQGWNSGDYNMQFECVFTAITIAFFLASFRKLPFYYTFLSAYSILIPLSTSIMSMPRYILTIFPIYILLAQYTRKVGVDTWVTVSLALLQGSFMMYWTLANRLIV